MQFGVNFIFFKYFPSLTKALIFLSKWFIFCKISTKALFLCTKLYKLYKWQLIITDECINCGACEPECPNTAIYESSEDWKFSDGTSLKGIIKFIKW